MATLAKTYGKDRRISYFGARLGENSRETPEGFMVFENVVIGRTGVQSYKINELNPEEADAAGLDSSRGGDIVELVRSPDEVFHPETISSFEGKSLTEGHPDDLVNLDNVRQHEQGHIQNIRRGGLLDSGDESLVADIVVKSKSLIQKIKNGLRELSCGYTYRIRRIDGRVHQIDICGNHVAVVSSGRAGSEASLLDSALPKEPTVANENNVVLMEKPAGQTWNKFLRAVGLASLAKDGRMADFAAASLALDTEVDVSGGADRAAADAAGTRAKDRKAFHDELDRRMDEEESAESERAAEDRMVGDRLSKLFGGKDAETDTEGEEAEREAEERGEDGDLDEEETDSEGTDGDLEESAGGVIAPTDRQKPIANSGTDRASGTQVRKRGTTQGTDSVASFLRLLRPAIAASRDAKLRKAFDAAAKQTNVGSGVRKGGAGYGSFQQASHGRDNAVVKTESERLDELNASFKARLRKGPNEK